MKSPLKPQLKMRGSSLNGKVPKPWDPSPSDADQRAAPSAAMGDYLGTAVKAQVGKMRSDSVGYRPVSRKQLGTPPRSVV